MFPEMEDSSPPTTMTAIRNFEGERGIALPNSYREFLLASNGGVPLKSSFPLSGAGNRTWETVQVFFGVGVRWPTTELAYAYDLYAGGLAHGVVPIAGNGAGDYVCLDLRHGGERVAFWDQRHFWGTGEWREVDLYHVADSFAEFIASLRPSPY